MLNKLSIKTVNLVGHSFGGGIASNFALKHPEKVNTLTLLEPAFAINYPKMSILFWATISSIDFLPDSLKNYGLSKITGEDPNIIESSNDPMAEMIKIATTGFTNSLPTPKTLNSDELSELRMPVYLGIADKSPLTGEKAIKNAKNISSATIRVWKNSTHSLPMEVPEKLGDELNKFWLENK